jgi:hypothetical protein
MGWGDAITTGTRWTSRAAGGTLALLATAYNERLAVANITTPFPVTFGHGDRLQDVAEKLIGLQKGVYNGSASPGLLFDFVDPIEPVSTANLYGLQFLDIGRVRRHQSLPTTYYYNAVGTNGTLVSDNENTQMRRRRSRRIAFTNATVDDQKNAAVAGQVAYFGNGRKMTCVSSGNWVTAPVDAEVDMLDNTRQEPNKVLAADPYGYARHGDILGWWFFEELRLTLDLLRWTFAPFSTQETDTKRFRGLPYPGYASRDEYVAAVNGGWPDAEPNTFGPHACGGYMANHPFADPIRWDAGSSCLVSRGRRKYTVGDTYTPALPHKYSMFMSAYQPFGPSTLGAASFHTHGDPVTLDNWTEFEGPGVVTTPTTVTEWIGSDVTTPPDIPPQTYFPAADEGIYFVENWGWAQRGLQAVHKWNVAGGFTTCTVTD